MDQRGNSLRTRHELPSYSVFPLLVRTRTPHCKSIKINSLYDNRGVEAVWPDHCALGNRLRVPFPQRDMPDPVRLNGMSSSAAALQMLERRQQVLSNNLANASTRGFKAESTFTRMMNDATSTTDTALDLTQGTLSETHNALDIAIEGDGFFVTQTPAGERFVRNGSFRLDADRRMVDDKGNAVLGEDGPITLPPGTVEIDKAGMVKVNGKPLQRLRVERVPDSTQLEHEGGTQFVPTTSRQVVPPNERIVRQGFIEESNVNPMSAMTAMLELLHRYGAAQKALSTIDAVRGIAVTDLAKPV